MHNGEQGLCRQAELIGNGHADATLAVVEAENSRHKLLRRNLRG